jgi:hypothetical protein
VSDEDRSIRKGKIVYRPPEKSYTNVNIEETPHGFKIYRRGSERAFTVIPHSAVKQVIYDREE